jgi:MFS family permease
VDGLGAHAALAAQSAAVAVSAGCASSALLAFSTSYPMLLVASAVVGVGSATFHPEASRVARMASGGRFGTAQSTFQVGGNTGSAIGPLLAAAIVIPHGQVAIAWLMLAAVLAILVLSYLTGRTLNHGQAGSTAWPAARRAGWAGKKSSAPSWWLPSSCSRSSCTSPRSRTASPFI